jgi:hypothetical protein
VDKPGARAGRVDAPGVDTPEGWQP